MARVKYLEIMRSTELQAGTDIDGAVEEGRLVFKVVVNGEILRDERELRRGKVALVVVAEGEFEFG